MNLYQRVHSRFRIDVVLLLVILLALCQLDSAYGVCDVHCSKCKADACRECNYGYWGHNCHRDCINCWVEGCEKESGRCIQCEPGYFGELCNTTCSDKCWSSRHVDKANCNRHTGECLQGCEVGWWGEQCHKRCSSGCQRACHQQDGACISGCKKGLFGRFCNKTYSPGCAEGSCSLLNGNRDVIEIKYDIGDVETQQTAGVVSSRMSFGLFISCLLGVHLV